MRFGSKRSQLICEKPEILLVALEVQTSNGFDTFSKERSEFSLFFDLNPGPTNVAANEA
jgi:hypothetical protein